MEIIGSLKLIIFNVTSVPDLIKQFLRFLIFAVKLSQKNSSLAKKKGFIGSAACLIYFIFISLSFDPYSQSLFRGDFPNPSFPFSLG